MEDPKPKHTLAVDVLNTQWLKKNCIEGGRQMQKRVFGGTEGRELGDWLDQKHTENRYEITEE